MNLFNIKKEYIDLINEIELQDGVLEEDQEEKLNILEAELDSKLHAYYYIIKQKQGEIQLLKDEQTRLSELAKSKENLINKLKEKVLEAVNIFGDNGKSGNKQIKYHDLNIYTVNKKVVEIDESEFKDERFSKYSITVDNDVFNKIKTSLPENSYSSTISKTALKEAIQSGEVIKGAAEIIRPHVVMR